MPVPSAPKGRGHHRWATRVAEAVAVVGTALLLLGCLAALWALLYAIEPVAK